MSSSTGPIKHIATLTSQAAWLLAAKIVGFGFSIVLPLLLTRLLNLAEFGLYKQAFLVIQTAQGLLSIGFSMSAFYFLPREPGRRDSVAMNIVVFNSLVGGFCFFVLLFYPQILVRILGNPDLIRYAPQIGMVLLLGMASSFFEIVATANQEVKYSALFVVGAQFTKSAALIGVTLWSASVEALLYGAMVQALFQIALMLWYMNSRFPGFWKTLDLPLMKLQLAYVIPLASAGIIYTLRTDYHNYSVSRAFGADIFGIYALGCMQLPLVGLLRESVMAVLIPRLSQLEEQGRHREVLLLSMRTIRKLAIAYWGMFALLSVAGYDLLVTMFTARFSASWPIFQINLLLLLTAIFSNDAVLRAYSQHRYYLLRLRIVLLVVLVAALELGILKFGLEAAIWTVILNMTVERVLITWKVGRILNFQPADLTHLRDLIRIGAAAAVAAGAAAATRATVAHHAPAVCLITGGSVFSVVYPTALWVSGALTGDEKALVLGKLNGIRRTLRLPVTG